MAIIETSKLTKTFGSNGAAVHALRGIDLVVNAVSLSLWSDHPAPENRP